MNTRVTTADGQFKSLQDLMRSVDGPLSLLSSNGQPVTIHSLNGYKKRVFRIRLALRRKPDSRAYPDASERHWSDLIVTSEQELLLQQRHRPVLHAEMANLDRLKVRISEALHGLPVSRGPITRDQSPESVHYDNFEEAFAASVRVFLDSHHNRTQLSQGTVLRKLTGVVGVIDRGTYLEVRSRRRKSKTFHWAGAPRQATDVETVLCDDSNEALRSAARWARQLRASLKISLHTLESRLNARFALEPSGSCRQIRVPIDHHLPGMTLVYDPTKSVRPWFIETMIWLDSDTKRAARYPFFNRSNRHDVAKQVLRSRFPEDPEASPFDTPLDELEHVPLDPLEQRMTVGEYLRLSREEQQNLCLSRPDIIEYNEKPVPLPPVFLGLWLADGSRESPNIANNHEEEVVNYLQHVAALYELSVKYYGHVTYALTSKSRSQRPLPPPRTAEERGELAPRLTEQEQRELRDAGYHQLKQGDPGFTRAHAVSNFIAPHDLVPAAASASRSQSPASTSLSTPPPENDDDSRAQAGSDIVVIQEGHTADLTEAVDPFGNEVENEVENEVADAPDPDDGASADDNASNGADQDNAAAADDDASMPSNADDIVPHTLRLQAPGATSMTMDEIVDFVLSPNAEDDRDPGNDMEGVKADVEGVEGGEAEGMDVDDVAGRIPAEEEDDSMDIDPPLAAPYAEAHPHTLDVPAASRRHPNRLLNALRELGVLYRPSRGRGPEHDSKRVPPEYMFNSASVRRQVIAGFIDGDGTYDYSSNTYVIQQSTAWHHDLLLDLLFVVRSLGYPCSLEWLDGAGHATADGQPSFEKYASGRLSFQPHLGEFPCLLERKVARGRSLPIINQFGIASIAEETGVWDVCAVVLDSESDVLRHDFLVLPTETRE